MSGADTEDTMSELRAAELVQLAENLRDAHDESLLLRREFDAVRSAVDLMRERLNAAYSSENVARAALLKFIHGDIYIP